MRATRLVPDSEAETANPRGPDNNDRSSTDSWRNEKKYNDLVGERGKEMQAGYSGKASPFLAGLGRRGRLLRGRDLHCMTWQEVPLLP